MAKGSGLLIALGDKPKDEPMSDEPDSKEGDYDTGAKTDLAQKFFEASSTGDFEKAGMVLEKFVHLCMEL
jgi:hypothetical protein